MIGRPESNQALAAQPASEGGMKMKKKKKKKRWERRSERKKTTDELSQGVKDGVKWPALAQTQELNITAAHFVCISGTKLRSASKAHGEGTTEIDCFNLEPSNIF